MMGIQNFVCGNFQPANPQDLIVIYTKRWSNKQERYQESIEPLLGTRTAFLLLVHGHHKHHDIMDTKDIDIKGIMDIKYIMDVKDIMGTKDIMDSNNIMDIKNIMDMNLAFILFSYNTYCNRYDKRRGYHNSHQRRY
jgi:hypothetical protein